MSSLPAFFQAHDLRAFFGHHQMLQVRGQSAHQERLGIGSLRFAAMFASASGRNLGGGCR